VTRRSAELPQETQTLPAAGHYNPSLEIRLNYSRIARAGLACFSFLTAIGCPQLAEAVISGEVYTAPSYGYGRVEARLRFAVGDGVVGSFFLWKDGSELSGMYWNELDFEKVGADCHFQTNAIYGRPSSNHGQNHPPDSDPCGTYHTYAYEWTPDYIAWLVDGVEIRRETGATAAAFADNAPAGMQIRLNVWPGDATFGGNFNPDILPVHQYVDWVQFSSFEGGTFTLAWREDFNGPILPAEWATATWPSPKNRSTHDPRNVNLIDGYLVISLTADDATGPAGAMPVASGGSSGAAQAGSAGAAGSAGSGAVAGLGGTTGSGSGGESSESAGSAGSGCSIDAPGEGRSNALLGALAVFAVAFARRRGWLLRNLGAR
jgi:endo-1,3-1,4-beta-glycanase ExoK